MVPTTQPHRGSPTHAREMELTRNADGSVTCRIECDIEFTPGPAAACIGDETAVAAPAFSRAGEKFGKMAPVLYSHNLVGRRAYGAFDVPSGGTRVAPVRERGLLAEFTFPTAAVRHGMAPFRWILTHQVPVGWTDEHATHLHSAVASYGMLNLVSPQAVAAAQPEHARDPDLHAAASKMDNVSIGCSTAACRGHREDSGREVVVLSGSLCPMTGSPVRPEEASFRDHGSISAVFGADDLAALQRELLGTAAPAALAAAADTLLERRCAVMSIPMLEPNAVDYIRTLALQVDTAVRDVPAGPGHDTQVEALRGYMRNQVGLYDAARPSVEAALARANVSFDPRLVDQDVRGVPGIDGRVPLPSGMAYKPGVVHDNDAAIAESIAYRSLYQAAAMYSGTTDGPVVEALLVKLRTIAQRQIDLLDSESPQPYPDAEFVDVAVPVLELLVSDVTLRYRSDEQNFSTAEGCKTFPVESMANGLEVAQTTDAGECMHRIGNPVQMAGGDCEDLSKGQATRIAMMRNFQIAEGINAPHLRTVQMLMSLFTEPLTALTSVNSSHIAAMQAGKVKKGLHCTAMMLTRTQLAEMLANGSPISMAYGGHLDGDLQGSTLQDLVATDPLVVRTTGGRRLDGVEMTRLMAKAWQREDQFGAILMEGTDLSVGSGFPGLFSVQHTDGTVSRKAFEVGMSPEAIASRTAEIHMAARRIESFQAAAGVESTRFGATVDTAVTRTRFLSSALAAREEVGKLGLAVRTVTACGGVEDETGFYRDILRLIIPDREGLEMDTGPGLKISQVRVGRMEDAGETFAFGVKVSDLVSNGKVGKLAAFWQVERDAQHMGGIHRRCLATPAAVIGKPAARFPQTLGAGISPQVAAVVAASAPTARPRVPSQLSSGYSFSNLDPALSSICITHSQPLIECEKIFTFALFLQNTAEAIKSTPPLARAAAGLPRTPLVGGHAAAAAGRAGGVDGLTFELLESKALPDRNTAYRFLVTVETGRVEKQHLAKYQKILQAGLKGLYVARDKRIMSAALQTIRGGRQRPDIRAVHLPPATVAREAEIYRVAADRTPRVEAGHTPPDVPPVAEPQDTDAEWAEWGAEPAADSHAAPLFAVGEEVTYWPDGSDGIVVGVDSTAGASMEHHEGRSYTVILASGEERNTIEANLHPAGHGASAPRHSPYEDAAVSESTARERNTVETNPHPDAPAKHYSGYDHDHDSAHDSARDREKNTVEEKPHPDAHAEHYSGYDYDHDSARDREKNTVEANPNAKQHSSYDRESDSDSDSDEISAPQYSPSSNAVTTPARGWAKLRRMPVGSHHADSMGARFLQDSSADTLVEQLLAMQPENNMVFGRSQISELAALSDMPPGWAGALFIVTQGPRGPRTSRLFEELRDGEWVVAEDVHRQLSTPSVVLSPCIGVGG